MLECAEHTEVLLTHSLVPAGPIPTVYDADGLYPYESYCETSRRPVLKKYRMVLMENDHICVKICPDLGGRVCSLFVKQAGVETLFFPPVIRPVRILPRQAFTGGGIELSFPVSHTPVEIVPVSSEVAGDRERIYVACGEREIRFGMHWTVEYSLGRDDEYLTQRTVFFNPDSEPHPWMSWSNAGVHAKPDTEFHFPGGSVLVHDCEVHEVDWGADGPRRQSDVRRMTGFFWKQPDCCAFGVFTPSLSAGLYHVADPGEAPGMKLWTDGIGRDEGWVSQYTLDGEQCLEIQAGPLIDQSVKDELAPGQVRHHTEFWIPCALSRNIRDISLPGPTLRPMEDVPRFGWAREDVELWLQLASAHTAGDRSRIPEAPDVDSNCWASCGIPDLGDALAWAADSTQREERDRWLFQHGAWLAGRGRPDEALKVLESSHDDRARALSGRIQFMRDRNPQQAADSFRAIESEAIALHPQIVVERDKALAALGRETLEERKHWLDAVSTLDDEWLAERRAALLLDSGDAKAAMDLLKTTRFQRVHQRYERTRLLRRIEASLGLLPEEYPAWLGEDDLAQFGAYREHPELEDGSL